MNKVLIKLLWFIPLVIITIAPVIWVDPLHIFGRDHGMNAEYFYDQRLVTTNILRYDKPEFNALIIGSSRIQHTGHMQIDGYQFFNLGLGNLMLADYPGYLKYAQQMAPDSIKCVIVTLDMYGSSMYRHYKTNWGTLDYYLEKSQDMPFLLKLMVSPNSFKYSTTQLYYYARYGEPPAKTWNEFRLSEIYYNKVFANWTFDESLIPLLKNLQRNYKDSKLIFMVTPVSVKHFQIIKQNGSINQFYNWLHILAKTVDGYYNFMDITPLTTHRENWRDGSHALPAIMEQQVRSILANDVNNPNYTYITTQNADSVISAIKTRIDQYDLEAWAQEKNTLAKSNK